VIGELEIVFGLNAVAIEVRVLRQLAILLKQLGALPRARLSMRLSC
jgi:hypothetical protein